MSDYQLRLEELADKMHEWGVEALSNGYGYIELYGDDVDDFLGLFVSMRDELERLRLYQERSQKAVENIDTLYENKKKPHPTSYEDGFLDGLDNALDILKKIQDGENE